MKKKSKIILIIIISFIVILTIILFNLRSVNDKKLIEYLRLLNFNNNNDSYLYIKQISNDTLEQYNNKIQNKIESEYEALYFNVNTYELTKDKMSYNDEISKTFTPTYSYVNDDIVYTYRINYDNTNIIFDGTYNVFTKKFTCDVTFSYQIDIEKSKNTICYKIQEEIEMFEYETKTLIDDPKLLQYMKRQNNK